MNLEELSAIWNSENQTIEETLTINKQLFKETSISTVKTHLTEFKWESILEIVFNSFFLFVLTNFIRVNILEFRFFAPAIIILILVIFDLFISAYLLYLYYNLDASKSIVDNQRLIERMKYFRHFEKRTLIVTIPLFSLALIIVIAKSIAGLDLYLFPNFLVSYLGGSICVAIVIVLFLHFFPDRNLQKTIIFLKELKEIEE